MKKTLGLLFLSATLSFAGAAAQLYDTGLRQTVEGKLPAARNTLQQLVDAYPHDPLALQAKGAIDATLLFEEGQARTKSSRYEAAQLAFETLIAVYPENPLVQPSRTALQSLAGKIARNHPVIRAMEFRNLSAATPDEIRAAMEEREVRLSVGRPYRAHDLEQARGAVEEILNQKGGSNVRVQAQIRAVAPHAVGIVFTVEKPRASLLRAPWRAATLAWTRVRP